jgi:hypothetical protein
MDHNRGSRIVHFEYSLLPYDFKLNGKSIIRNLFKIIGHTREFLNFYAFPLEITLRDLYFKSRSKGDGHESQRQLKYTAS